MCLKLSFIYVIAFKGPPVVHCNCKSRNDGVKLGTLHTVDVIGQRKGYWRDSLSENVVLHPVILQNIKYHTLKCVYNPRKDKTSSHVMKLDL